jgi:predicted transposase YdaD
MKVARMEGRAEGRAEGLVEGHREGLKIGTIHVAERMLHRPETPVAQLLTLSIDDLRSLADDLHEQVAATMKNLPDHR